MADPWRRSPGAAAARRPTWKNQKKTIATQKKTKATTCLVRMSPHTRPAAVIATQRRRQAARCVVAEQLHGDVEGAEDLGPGSAFQGERPFSPRRATCPGRREGVGVASRASKTSKNSGDFMVDQSEIGNHTLYMCTHIG